MIRRARIAAAAVLLAGAALAAAPQTAPPTPQPPTFKLEVNYVEVDALVTDQQGNFVRGLTSDDFKVFEDGKPQTISAFSVVDLPVERAERVLGAARPVEPDVRSNAQPFDGRVYVMIIDDLHTLFGRTERVKRAARLFIERHLGANDLMAVVHTAGPTDASQEFTGNKQLLLAAVDRSSGRKLRSATLSRTENYYNTRNPIDAPDASDPDEAERGYNARSTLQTIKNVADWFSSVRGRRKSILLVSEGIDYDITDVFNNPHASSILDETRDVIAAATRSNVSIFGIDPRGLTNLGDEDIQVQSYPDDTSLGIGSGSLVNEVRLSQDSLRTLSDETGGFATVNRNDFQTAYDRIVRDNSTYYVLGLLPAGRQARREVPQDRGPRRSARAHRARAQGVHGAEREGAVPGRRHREGIARADRGDDQPPAGQRPDDARVRGAVHAASRRTRRCCSAPSCAAAICGCRRATRSSSPTWRSMRPARCAPATPIRSR